MSNSTTTASTNATEKGFFQKSWIGTIARIVSLDYCCNTPCSKLRSKAEAYFPKAEKKAAKVNGGTPPPADS